MTEKAPICILALAIEERPRFVGELERLTEVLYTAIPAPSDCEEKSQWDYCFVVAAQVECSPIVMYDSGEGEDISLTKDVQWRARVCEVLSSLTRGGHEIMFVLDETELEERAPIEKNNTREATDAFEGVLPGHLEFLSPFMKSRPIVLRPGMSRYNAAQCLDRIVCDLHIADENDNASEMTVPMSSFPALSPESKTGRGISSNVTGTPRLVSSSPSMVSFLPPSLKRRTQVRRQFEGKVFLKPSPDDLPIDPLREVGLRYNATVISSESESGGVGHSLLLQLAKHYRCFEAGSRSYDQRTVVRAIEDSAYVVIVFSQRFLTDPWCLALLNFVVKTRMHPASLQLSSNNGNSREEEEDYEVIWVREASLLPLEAPRGPKMVEPFLDIGLQRLIAAGWEEYTRSSAGSSTFNVEHRDTKQDSGLMKARLRAAIRIGLYRAEAAVYVEAGRLKGRDGRTF